ncbi:MAG: hypothetical protein ABH842_06345 [Candidatus Micrarchaeota archaeon]
MLLIKNNYIFCLILVFILISGCGQKQDHSLNSTNQINSTLKGVTLTPKSFQSSDFNEFFVKANQAGSLVAWAGDWNELGENDGGPKVVAELAPTYGYTPVIEVQFFTQSDGNMIREFDDNTKMDYKAKAVAFAEKYKPEYFGLGIEVNILYEKSESDFNDFVSFYSEVYDAIKQKSPNTKVFTVFQLEKMKGLGFFNTPNSSSQWSLLNKFPKSDIIAFTTYPDLVYSSPSDIPDEYYGEIKAHTSKPIAFTEIGWHTAAEPSGWESSENEQSEFLSIFFNQTSVLNKEFIIWSFLYDQNTIQPFDSMGLIDEYGTSKLAWNVWINN